MPPPVPLVAVRRDRLEQVLDEHPNRRVVLVRGPAGAGKTVLVALWVSAQGGPCAWLPIDSTHNDPNRLLWHVIEAVERLSPNAIGTVAGSRIGAGVDGTVLRGLLDLVSVDLGMRITLVFDDVHLLHDEAARQVIGQLVEHPPGTTRVVLVSRSKPRLGLERARLRGDLVEVLPAMLRFGRAEIDMVTASWGAGQADVTELERSTLGWAAGLRLAQLDALGDEVSSAALGEPAGIASEYVREEFLDGTSGVLYSFLEVTCWPPQLTEALCVVVAAQIGQPLASLQPALEALPIVPIASRPGAFRYPPIMARAVQREYRRRNPELATTSRYLAAEACHRAGELLPAVELFMQDGCADEAAEVCADMAAESEASLGAVDELLHRMNDEGPGGATWVPWRVRAAVAAGHVDEGRQLLEQADQAERSPDPEDQVDDHDLVIARAAVAERIGDVATLLACSERLLTQGASAVDRHVKLAHGRRVRALVWSGETEDARVAARTARASSVTASAEVVDLSLADAWLAWVCGDIMSASEHTEAAGREAGEAAEHASELALLAGAIHRERNQLAKATALLERAQSIAATESHRVVAALAASELARCHLAAGCVLDALEVMVTARAAHPHLPSGVDACLRSAELRVRLDRGDVDGARACLYGAPPGVETELLTVRVEVLRSAGHARDRLEAIDAQTPRQAIDKLLLHAQLPDIDEGDAAAALVAAISAGGHLGLVRTFLDEGPAVSRRLQQLALESPDPALGRLAALVSQELSLGPAAGPVDLVEELTPRELAVLRLLPLRMSNQEMAAQMYISVNTIKTHVRAIYRKLDVPHRSAAVRRARSLQLV